MDRKLNRSQTLRCLAEQFLAELPDDALTSPRRDLATSLVRQWLTNDDHATLFVGGAQHYLRICAIDSQTASIERQVEDVRVWFGQVMRDWEFDDDALDDAIQQLNICQSAEIENCRGQFLRIRVNGRDRHRQIEPLSQSLQRPLGVAPKRDFAKIARDELERIFGAELDPETRGELVGSIVRQWAANDGHAVIITATERFQFVISVLPDGTGLTTKRRPTNFQHELVVRGILNEEIPHFIHAINLGQVVEFTDEVGRRYRVSVDPVKGVVALTNIQTLSTPSPSIRIDNLKD